MEFEAQAKHRLADEHDAAQERGEVVPCTAKAAKRGIWAGPFTPPWDWRKGKRDVDAAAAVAPSQIVTERPPSHSSGSCLIKGNINHRGEHIYHVPGLRDYEQTVINEASGERMFYSEEEATSAGWREPR